MQSRDGPTLWPGGADRMMDATAGLRKRAFEGNRRVWASARFEGLIAGVVVLKFNDESGIQTKQRTLDHGSTAA